MKNNTHSKRGNAMLVVVVMTAGMAGMALTMATTLSSGSRQERGYREETTSMLAAEAGVAEAVFDLRSGGEGMVGTEYQPVAVGAADCWAETVALGGGQFAVRSTGTDRTASTRLELVLQLDGGSFFNWAAFGDDGLTMSSNAFVDSYDSSAGTYASQEVNGSGSDAWANDEGHVGSNAGIQMDQNTLVFGNAQPGPTSSVTLLGSAAVSGSTTPAADTVDMPAIARPLLPSIGDMTTANNSTTSVATGDWGYGAVVLGTGSSFEVAGPATLVFDSLELRSGSQFLVDATNGPVEIFVIGDFIMNSNTLMSSLTNTPSDITLNLESDNVIDPDMEVDLDVVDFESNAQLYGTIYAPNAAIEINSNFELFGSLVARRVHLDSNARVHFDEALRTGGGDGSSSFTTVCWRVLPD